MRKVVWWIIAVIAVALVSFRALQHARPPVERVSEEIPLEVVVEQVTRGDVARTISFTGNIVGQEQVNVHPVEETGRLIRYLVKEGDRVSRGSAIALVDRSIKGMEFKPAEIASPISGVVGMLYLDKGAVVSPQIPVAMIVDMDKVKVEIRVVERDLPAVRTGQRAEVRVDAYQDTVFHGELTRLTPVVDPLSKTAKGEIVINNPRRLLKPGGFAKVNLIVEEHKDVLVVPEKAVLTRAGKQIVFLATGDLAKEVEVRTGLTQRGETEIVSGLEGGESVIALGNYGLRDGAKIVKMQETLPRLRSGQGSSKQD